MCNMIKVGSDFSGVGAFNQALNRLGIEYDEIFACDMDNFARKTFIHNYGQPKYYPGNVYERKIPKESLDIYMTSPPCQSFSVAGNRKGKDDARGVLFFNSLEFIKENKPRYFIFENVKGLLSDDDGKTFQEWINFLGGKSVNGLPVLFPYDDSVQYHIYWKILNAKKHGIPQNRERVFIIGIRDDQDNQFQFPKEEYLTKRLKDILETEVDKKYFLSDKLLKYFGEHKGIHQERGNGFKFEPHNLETIVSNAISTKCGSRQTDPFIKIKLASEMIQIDPSLESARQQPYLQNKILDINGINPTLMPLFHWGKGKNNERMVYDSDGISPCMISAMGMGGGYTPSVIDQYKIRRLTPRECFRLMDFPDIFDFSCVSDSQAYKQAGNSICVGVLVKIIEKFRL